MYDAVRQRVVGIKEERDVLKGRVEALRKQKKEAEALLASTEVQGDLDYEGIQKEFEGKVEVVELCNQLVTYGELMQSQLMSRNTNVPLSSENMQLARMPRPRYQMLPRVDASTISS